MRTRFTELGEMAANRRGRVMSSASGGDSQSTEPQNGEPGKSALAASASAPPLPGASVAASPQARSRPLPPNGVDEPRPEAASAHHHHEISVRGAIAGLLAGAATFLTAGPAPVVAIITVWVFAFFPWLRPWEPPVEQKLTISNAVVAERSYTLANREERTAIFFDIEAIGYDREPVLVATLWLDAVTGKRVESEFYPHGILESNTRTNRWVHWLNVEYPELPADSSGCLVVRVLLFLMPEGEPASTMSPDMDTLTERAPLLAYADTAAFDPYEVGDGACSALGETS